MSQVVAIGVKRRRSRRTRSGKRSTARLPSILAAVAAALFVALYLALFAAPAEAVSDARFELCETPPHRTCVIDGDTLYLNGEAIRVADIDTPETHPARCRIEADLGTRATRRLLALVDEGPFTMSRWDDRDEDGHGRKLRVLRRNGTSLGAILIGEGLARPWTGSRQPWCG